MTKGRKRLGDLGEEIAQKYLQQLGYRIVEKNYRCTTGEVDVVAYEGYHLVFVEVRTRTSRSFGTPEESVTEAKQEKLVEVAESYLQEHSLANIPWRIDVVVVELEHPGRLKRMEVIKNAVTR